MPCFVAGCQLISACSIAFQSDKSAATANGLSAPGRNKHFGSRRAGERQSFRSIQQNPADVLGHLHVLPQESNTAIAFVLYLISMYSPEDKNLTSRHLYKLTSNACSFLQ